MNALALCALGLVDHDFQRVVSEDRSGDLRCGACKIVYDPSVFEPETLAACPRCDGPLKPPRTWQLVCVNCGAEK